MKIVKRINILFVVLLMLLLPFNLSARAEDLSYYIVGSFNDNKISEKYKMEYNSDSENFEYLFENLDEYTQLRVSDGVNSYRSEGLNKGSSFLLKDKGSYRISFNVDPILDGKNVRIDKLKDQEFYALGSFNSALSDEYKFKMVDYKKYELTISVLDYSLLYISDGVNEYRNINGNDYILDEKGCYKLEFNILNDSHNLRITKIVDDKDYYVCGSFNSFSENSESKMIYSNGLYRFRLDTINVESFYITDGENVYKNGRSNYLLDGYKSYEICFNSDTLAVDINEINYFILCEDNSYSENLDYKLNVNKDNKDYLEYEITLNVIDGYQFSVGNSKLEYLDNGSSFLIKDAGEYRILFSPDKKYDGSNVSIIKLKDSKINYYVLGEFNSYAMDDDSLMDKDGDLYTFRVDTIKASSFYITDGDNIYRNGRVDYLLNDHTSYLISFNSNTKEVLIEKLDYYILCSETGFNPDKDYLMSVNKDNDLFLEYSFNITITEPFQFIVGNEKYEYNNNEGSFLINDEGQYTIYFSLNHLYENDSFVKVMKYKEENDKFYLMGSFNSDTNNNDYLLKYNKDNKDYIEYIIDIDLLKGDSFYIHSLAKDYYSPKGDMIMVSESASYRIYFSEEYDYGNGYHIYYKIIKNDSIEERTIIINNSDDLIDFINKCNMDSFSTNLTVEIRNDIDLKGATISPIMVFSGALNGNFHRIYNFKLDTRVLGSEIAFIRRLLDGASVNNLEIDYNLTLDSSDTMLGGIVGLNKGVIRNSTFKGNLNGISIVGGIAAKNSKDASIIGCTSGGSIIARSFVGGICGVNNGVIKECVNESVINNTIYSSSDERRIMNIGGIAGFNTNEILKSYNKARVGTNKLGGFVGGISGNSTGIVSECYNLGSIYGKKYVGGIVGYFAELKNNNEDNIYDEIIKEIEDILKPHEDELTYDMKASKVKGSLSYSYNKGNVYADSQAGGIAGFASSEGTIGSGFNICLSYNLANVKVSLSYAGGIVGEHIDGIISEVYNSGIIESEGKDYVGGIAGSSNGEIMAAFNTGSIKGKSYVGGISGYLNKCNNTYNIGAVYPDGSFVGGIAGSAKEINNNVYNNYYINNGYKAFDNIDYDNKGMEIKRNILASKDILKVDLDFKYFMVSDSEESYPMLKGFVNLDNSVAKAFNDDIIEASRFSCEVIFVDDDGSIYQIHKVEYGSDFDLANLPEPIKKEGYLSKWDKSFTGKNITEDVIVSIVYTEIRTSIGSDNTKSDIIVEGIFTPTTKATLKKSGDNYLGDNSMYKHIGTYILDIADSENDISLDNLVVSLRLDNTKNKQVVIIKDNTLVFVDSEISNDYIRFNLDGSLEFMIVERELYNISNPEFVRIITLSTIGVLSGIVVLAGAIGIINNRRKKRI